MGTVCLSSENMAKRRAAGAAPGAVLPQRAPLSALTFASSLCFLRGMRALNERNAGLGFQSSLTFFKAKQRISDMVNLGDAPPRERNVFFPCSLRLLNLLHYFFSSRERKKESKKEEEKKGDHLAHAFIDFFQKERITGWLRCPIQFPSIALNAA